MIAEHNSFLIGDNTCIVRKMHWFEWKVKLFTYIKKKEVVPLWNPEAHQTYN